MSDRIDLDVPGDDGAAHGERWNAELAAYALDALDPAERRVVDAHLEACEACRERLRWVLPAVDVLPATVAQRTPPPELKARLMDVVERESAPAPAAGGREPVEPARRRFPGIAGLRLRPALAGLAVVLLLGAAVVGYALRDGGGTGEEPSAEVFAARAAGGSGATGRLEVSGDSGMLHVSDLPPTHEGEVYQAWIQDRPGTGGSVHASSVFVVSGDGTGDVAIPHGLADARRVMVTREPKGGSEHPSESSVLTAEMD